MRAREGRPRGADPRGVAADLHRPDCSTSPPGPAAHPVPLPPVGPWDVPLEAAAPPPGMGRLAETIERLAETVARLEVVLDRQARPVPEPLAYRNRDAARMCGVSVRLWERLRAAGKAPKPDAVVGDRCPVWSKQTLERWLAQGGSK